MEDVKDIKVLVGCGGTGGHIFPGLSIADEIKKREPSAEILFVGARGRMEMTRVPDAGYKIVGLPIAGLQRRICWSNFLFPFKLLYSLFLAYRLIKRERPDFVVGTGGYASAPIVRIASLLKIPSYIQEQNSFAGVTNKWLSKSVSSIFVAYEKMDRFFPKEKIVLTGNPIRTSILEALPSKKQALEALGIKGVDENRGVIVVVGGSLGAATLNDSIGREWEAIEKSNCHVIWQTGSYYYKKIEERFKDRDTKNITIMEFIKDMNSAFAAADVVISRAGASTLSELTVVGKPAILVPSPNVSEDHQTHNAMALVDRGAALLVKDIEAREILVQKALSLVEDRDRLDSLSEASKSMGRPNAVKDIVSVIMSNYEREV